ncbi:MAG: tyrosine-type recombinase/integrase [Saprospiraceae bacterium]
MTVTTAQIPTAPRGKSTPRTTSFIPWNLARLLVANLQADGQHNVALMVAAGIYFGLRISDTLKLTWGQITAATFTTTEGKTGKVRHIAVHPDFAAARDRYLATFYDHAQPGAGQYVFTPQRSHKGNRPISVTAANKRFAAALEKYEITTANASTHTLRKTFGRRVWENGGKSEAALVLLSDILNHQSIAVTRRYLGITADEIAAAYTSL